MEYNIIKIENIEKKDTVYTYLKRAGFSENYVKNLRKKEGYILLNDKIAHTDFIIKNGDVLKLNKNPNTKTSIMHCIIPLDVVYEDNDILVINKPSGLTTSPSRSHYTENLSGAILAYMSKKDNNFVVRIVNRLDKDTAGLVMIAKHSTIAKLLNENTEINKTYYAICTGEISKKLLINQPIETTKNELGYNNHKRVISPKGKPAITYVTPLLFDGANTLCKINIEHGRTHQIRVHLSHIGHSLLGDELYGQKSELISHTALACCEIAFTNSETKKEHCFKCPIPNNFIKAFKLNTNFITTFEEQMSMV